MPDPSPTELARELTRGIDALLRNLRDSPADNDHLREQLETFRQRTGTLARSIEAAQSDREALRARLTPREPETTHRHTDQAARHGFPRAGERQREKITAERHDTELPPAPQDTERRPDEARTGKAGFTNLLEALNAGAPGTNPRARTQPLPVFADELQIGDPQTGPRDGINLTEVLRPPIPSVQRSGRTTSTLPLALPPVTPVLTEGSR